MLGVIADANSDAEGRWRSLRERCVESFPGLPDELPASGLISENEDGLKLGVWLMPDNKSHGMLETFLNHLVPSESDRLLKHAERARDKAKTLGAPFKEVHSDKAKIYTWLSWQNPPGRQLHDAVKQRILEPGSPFGRPFVGWFRTLFDL